MEENILFKDIKEPKEDDFNLEEANANKIDFRSQRLDNNNPNTSLDDMKYIEEVTDENETLSVEGNNMILNKLKDSKLNMVFKENGIIDNDYNVYIYKTLKKSFTDYKGDLLNAGFIHLRPQLTIDFLVSMAIKYKKEDSLTDQEKRALKAIKMVLLEEMENNNPLIMGTLLFANKEYLYGVFDTKEEKKVINKYANYITSKLKSLINKYKITGESNNVVFRLNYEIEDMSAEDELFLFKALESPIVLTSKIGKEYKKQREVINRILLYRLEYIDKLSKIETEYIINKCAKDKCRKNRILYRKVYLSDYYISERTLNDDICNEEDKNDDTYGTHNTSGLILVSMANCDNYNFIPTTLHECEHLNQSNDRKREKLNSNSLSISFDLFIRQVYSNEFFNEYGRNYSIKTVEILANEAARKELNEILNEYHIKPTLHTNKSRGKEGYLYQFDYANYKATDINNNKYTMHLYNVIMLERALDTDVDKIEKFPLLKIFCEPDKKRLKNLTELAKEYKKQDVNGRNTFPQFVQYQVLKGDLDNVQLVSMNDVDRLNFILMILRSTTYLLSHLSITFVNRGKLDTQKEVYKALKKCLKFLKDNKNYIDKLHQKVLSTDDYLDKFMGKIKAVSVPANQKDLIKDQMNHEFFSHDRTLDTRIQLGRDKIKSNLGVYQGNPFYLLNLYTRMDIKSLLKKIIMDDIKEEKLNNMVDNLDEPNKTMM